MKQYSFIQPFYLAFYSRSLYRDVAMNWTGLCLRYLLVLLALCVIPTVMKVEAEISLFLNNEAPKIVKQLPTITISKGKVSIDKPEPFFIRNEKTGLPLMIIDTTCGITSLKGSGASVLLTKSELIVKKSETETERFDLSDYDGFTIDRTRIYGWMDAFEDGFFVVLYPFSLLFSFLFHVLEVLVYSVIGAVFVRLAKASLNYKALFRLTVIAMTPVLIFEALIVLAGIEIPYWWPIRFLISMGYLHFAVRAITNKEAVA